MATDLDLANSGLLLVGQRRITSLNNPLGNAVIETAAFFLDRVKRAVLRAHDWNCARTRKTFAEVTNESLGEWLYAFRVPPECLCVRRFVSDLDKIKYARFSVETDSEEKPTLYTTDGCEKVVFTRNLQDTNRFDALLFDTIAVRLAIDFAAVFPKDQRFVQTLWSMYQAKLDEAIGVSDSEGQQERPVSQSLMDIR